MSQVAVTELVRPEAVTYTPAQRLGAALKLRSELSRSVRAAWATPEATIVKDTLTEAAYKSGFADGMRNLMNTIADQIRALAERTIKDAYREVWAKPTRR